MRCNFLGGILSFCIRSYIGQGLRADLERLDGDTVSMLIASLKHHGVSDEVIRKALSEVA
ncbi:hypothetical protein VB774_12975 [Pseudanabaena galeata UHCC 0370]|uniref:Uncharacterized protein n=1 Tax=Pseudanabaena galeata UHCC 0370 TaxID=3110310 RepID=A0ABU5TK41_9CYAN|nr:hypothetical protein [Pseudanabaena galeata]MEA5478534.1 hypothetical protein [Pseudanabaena galeata UHCC 0370]